MLLNHKIKYFPQLKKRVTRIIAKKLGRVRKFHSGLKEQNSISILLQYIPLITTITFRIFKQLTLLVLTVLIKT